MVDIHQLKKRFAIFSGPQEIIIATIRRGAKEIIARGDTVIRSGDILIVVRDLANSRQGDRRNDAAEMPLELLQ